MLTQGSKATYYARGMVNKAEDSTRIATQHLQIFWRAPIVEGQAGPQGHVIDADEPPDPFEVYDAEDKYDLEAQAGLLAAQRGELLTREQPSASSCCETCPRLFCEERELVDFCPHEDE